MKGMGNYLFPSFTIQPIASTKIRNRTPILIAQITPKHFEIIICGHPPLVFSYQFVVDDEQYDVPYPFLAFYVSKIYILFVVEDNKKNETQI